MNDPGPVRLPVNWEPLSDLLPNQEPEAVHDVALLELQDNCDAPPDGIDVGLAERLTIGAGGGGGTDTLTVADLLVLPPEPVQVRV